MKKFLLIFLFLIITPINLGVSLSLLGKSSFLQTVPAQASSQLYAALPQTIGQVLGTFETDDARPIIISKYLEKYQSPMAPYADLIVETSDKYGLDWRLLVAIAQQESNLGKKAPSNSYNAWGWGVHSLGTLRFQAGNKVLKQSPKVLKKNISTKATPLQRKL